MRRNRSRGAAKGDVGKVTFAVVAIVAAITFVALYVKSQQGYEVKHVDLPSGSAMKLSAMKQMKADKASQSGAGGYSPGSLGGGGTVSGAPAGAAFSQDSGDRNQDARGGN